MENKKDLSIEDKIQVMQEHYNNLFLEDQEDKIFRAYGLGVDSKFQSTINKKTIAKISRKVKRIKLSLLTEK